MIIMHDFIYKLKFFLEREVQSLKNELEDKTELLAEIITFCKQTCEHEWIDDLIDIDPDKSKRIFYCQKCYLQKE